MDYESIDDNAVERFSNFNFGQSIAKILDNMGFAAATGDALEILTSIMRRYFEDLCQRIVVNKDHGGRELPSLGDINIAFQTQNVSLLELNDYMRQVQKLPASFPMPQYPVQQFSESETQESKSHIFHADPFAEDLPTIEEIEERYGKKEVEVDQVMEESVPEIVEEPKMNIRNEVVKVKPKIIFNSWKIPDDIESVNFSGKIANDLGFDIDLYRRKFAEVDNRQSIGMFKLPSISSDASTLFMPQSSSVSQKMHGLNNLVEKIKRHKEKKKDKNRDKDRRKDKDRHEKKKRKKDDSLLVAPTLTPAIPILTPAIPILSKDPDSGMGDSLKNDFPTMVNIAQEPVKTISDSPFKFEPIQSKPLEIVSIPEPIKVEIQPITPPPTLEQIVIPTIEPIIQPTSIQPAIVASEEVKKEKSKKHKKKHKKNREKDESRKRKHDQISNSLPPVLEPSTLPTIPNIEKESQESLPLAIATKLPETTNNDKPPTPVAGAVRLKIRIGNTLSSDSMHSSPLGTTASKPHSASITPPILTKELIPSIEDVVKLIPEIIAEVKPNDESIVNVDGTEEPPRKKHKKEKKHKKDKERASILEGNEQKSEHEEKHKKRSKEHKEKKREKRSNDRSIEDKLTPDPIPFQVPTTSESKVVEEVPVQNEPLRMKFNKPLPEIPTSEETTQQVKEILSAIKESHDKKDRKEKTDSNDKEKKAKKHKKEKKHKHSKEPSLKESSSSSKDKSSKEQSSKSDQPSSSASKSDRPSSSASLLKESPVKPVSTIKVLNQSTRPSSQNSTKLFEPAGLKPEIPAKIEPKVKKDVESLPKKVPEIIPVKKNSIVKKEPESSKKSIKPSPSKPQKSSSKATTPTPQPIVSKAKEKPKSKDKKPGQKKDNKNIDPDDVWVCPKCSVAYVDGAADMIGCDQCNNWYHFQCVGMLRPPPENEAWFCPPCVQENRKKGVKGRKK